MNWLCKRITFALFCPALRVRWSAANSKGSNACQSFSKPGPDGTEPGPPRSVQVCKAWCVDSLRAPKKLRPQTSCPAPRDKKSGNKARPSFYRVDLLLVLGCMQSSVKYIKSMHWLLDSGRDVESRHFLLHSTVQLPFELVSLTFPLPTALYRSHRGPMGIV